MLLFNGKSIYELIQQETEVLEKSKLYTRENKLAEYSESLVQALEFTKQCIEKEYETAH